MNKLIIGCEDANFLNDGTKCLEGLCLEYNIPYELKSQSGLLQEALINQEIDTYVDTLASFPLVYDEKIVIAGLSERSSFAAIVKSETPAEGITSFLGISLSKSLSVTGTNSNLLYHQIATQLPDQKIRDESDNLIMWGDSESLQNNHRAIDVRDLIPPTGAGVYCFLCLKSNITARRLIKNVHYSNTAYCTNVERTFIKLLDPKPTDIITAHCFRDRMGNYHLYAFVKNNENEGVKIHLSQSTFIKLAENAIIKLNNEVSHF